MEISKFIQDFESCLEETDSGTISADTRFRDLDEWSSMLSLVLIATVNEEYDLKLTGEEIKNSQTIEDIFNKLNSKI